MRKFFVPAFAIATAWFSVFASAAELRLPGNAVAGQSITIGFTGEGDGVLYLIGPAQIIQRPVKLSQESQVAIKGEDLRSAGRWIAVLRSGARSHAQAFWVVPAKPESLSFLARPSRVPVD